jgi:homopolymeric O-antigen transport system permease protein
MSTTASSLDVQAPQSYPSSPTWHGPVTIIEPTTAFKRLSLSQLWSYRELIYFFIWRELKVRYKQAVLGVAWVVLQPLMMTLTFTVVLGLLVHVPSDNIPYVLFAFSGLMIWTFVSVAISNSGNSLVGNAALVTKIYFPRVVLPLAAVASRLVDLGVSLTIFIALMVYFRIGLTVRILAVPLVILWVTLLALAIGMWISAMNVKYRDVSLAVPVLLQIGMFLSPIVYPLSLIPPRWQFVYSLNPVVGVLEGFRAVVFSRPFHWTSISISIVITAVLLVYAAFVFGSRERTFADFV